MQKLRLDLDKLTVESFEAGKDDSLKGTAHGYQDTCSCQPTCGVASRGQEGYDQYPRTRYACCV
jgi:hypothetical protein